MNIKELRARQGYSQEGLAQLSGVALRTIQRIENGETAPQQTTLHKLATALNVNIDEISTTLGNEELRYLKKMTNLFTVLLFQPMLSIIVMVIIRSTNNSLAATSKKYLKKLIYGQTAILLVYIVTALYIMKGIIFSRNISYLYAMAIIYLSMIGVAIFYNLYAYRHLKKTSGIKKP